MELLLLVNYSEYHDAWHTACAKTSSSQSPEQWFFGVAL